MAPRMASPLGCLPNHQEARNDCAGCACAGWSLGDGSGRPACAPHVQLWARRVCIHTEGRLFLIHSKTPSGLAGAVLSSLSPVKQPWAGLGWALFSKEESPVPWLECGDEFSPIQEKYAIKIECEGKVYPGLPVWGEAQGLGAVAELWA